MALLKSHSIVLVDLNEFPSIFQKVQHSHSRLQKTATAGKGSLDKLQNYRTGHLGVYLKEKLPQAFMQIGWMEDDFRNLTAKIWANLDNPIKRSDFSKVSLFCVCRPLRWHSSNICDVTTVQLSNGTVHKFLQNFTFHKNVSSLFFYTQIC